MANIVALACYIPNVSNVVSIIFTARLTVDWQSAYANECQATMVAIVYVFVASARLPRLPRSSNDHYSHSLTTISLSRILLNLRGLAYRSDEVVSATEGSASRSPLSTLDFSQFVGSLGNAVDDNISDFEKEDIDIEDVRRTDNATAADSMAVADIELELICRTP